MELADEDRRLVTTGAVHLINHVLGAVIAARHPSPVEEMARILREGTVALPAPELWQFCKDLDLKGPGAVHLLEKVLRHSSPRQLDPNDPHFRTYLEVCWLVIAKMGDALADAAEKRKDRAPLTLLGLAAIMRQGRQDLRRVAMYDGVMSTGRVHVVIDTGASRDVETPLSHVVRQLGWLFEGIAPYWDWEVTLIGQQEGSDRDAIRDVFILEGGNSKFRIEDDPLERLFAEGPQRRRVFGAGDAASTQHDDHDDDAAGDELDAHDFTILMDLSLATPISAVGTFIHDLAFERSLYVVAAAAAKGSAGARSQGPDAHVAKTLLKNLSSAAPHVLPGCWTRLSVYRTAHIRQMHAASAFRCQKFLATEAFSRAVTREAQLNDNRQAVEKKPKHTLVSVKPIPHLPGTKGQESILEANTLESFLEWEAIARSLASDQLRKNAVFQKHFIVCTEHRRFVNFVTEARMTRAWSQRGESDLSTVMSMRSVAPTESEEQLEGGSVVSADTATA